MRNYLFLLNILYFLSSANASEVLSIQTSRDFQKCLKDLIFETQPFPLENKDKSKIQVYSVEMCRIDSAYPCNGNERTIYYSASSELTFHTVGAMIIMRCYNPWQEIFIDGERQFYCDSFLYKGWQNDRITFDLGYDNGVSVIGPVNNCILNSQRK